MAHQLNYELAHSIALADLPLTSFIPQRYRPGHLGTWSGHLAFAHDLIAALTPSLIVELGTHWGESYFTFCQSIFENRLQCQAYAVDHWLGEAHSGLYGDEVFGDVSCYNNLHYGQFSELLRTSFDDALNQFSDKSIDLLHIDGFHTYEAVSHDLRSWLPKVKPGGIILLHDIAVRHANFGVWRLWEEIKQEFQDTFEFHHSWGLGVIRKRGDGLTYPMPLNILFRGSADVHERLRRHYCFYASHLEATLRTTGETTLRIYPFGTDGYREETGLTQTIGIDESRKISFFLPHGLGNGPLRINPAACPGVIDITRTVITDITSNALLWEADGVRLLAALTVAGSAVRLMNSRSGLIVSYGDDPQLFIPAITESTGPVRVEITLRLVTSYGTIFEALQLHACETEQSAAQSSREQIEQIDRELNASRAAAEDLMAELRAAQGERMMLTFEMKQAIFDRHAAERELKQMATDRGFAPATRDILQDSAVIVSPQHDPEEALESLRSQRDGFAAEVARLTAALQQETIIRGNITQSVSWRVTEPARTFMRGLRGVLSKSQ